MHIQTHTHAHTQGGVYSSVPNRCTFTPISIHFTHIFTHFMYLRAPVLCSHPPLSHKHPHPSKTPPLIPHHPDCECVKVMIAGCELGADKPQAIVTCLITSIDPQEGMWSAHKYLPAPPCTPPLPVRVCPCIVLELCRERPCLTLFD